MVSYLRVLISKYISMRNACQVFGAELMTMLELNMGSLGSIPLLRLHNPIKP